MPTRHANEPLAYLYMQRGNSEGGVGGGKRIGAGRGERKEGTVTHPYCKDSHTHTQTHKHTDTQTCTREHTHTHTHIQTHTHTHTHETCSASALQAALMALTPAPPVCTCHTATHPRTNRTHEPHVWCKHKRTPTRPEIVHEDPVRTRMATGLGCVEGLRFRVGVQGLRFRV